MIFEQPASLNRFLEDPTPWNWTRRWRAVQIFLPLLAFMTIALLEQVVILFWLRDRLTLQLAGFVLLIPVFLLAGLMILNEINRRLPVKSSRKLNLLEQGISYSASSRPIIRWSSVTAFWFEPIPGEPWRTMVTLGYLFRGRPRRRLVLVLDQASQCPAFLSELNLLQQRHQLNFRVEMAAPPPIPPLRNPVLGLSLALAGMLFFYHGCPMLVWAVSHHFDPVHHSESANWSPKQMGKLARFQHAHFQNEAQYIHYVVGTGIVLTSISIGLLIAGRRVQRPKP